MNDFKFEIETIKVEAKSRKLKVKWTLMPMLGIRRSGDEQQATFWKRLFG